MIYFAYGSNMLRQRLHARVGTLTELGAVCLARFRLTFSKRGNDGSGKCTLAVGGADDIVWGVAFELSVQQKQLLDRFEGPAYEVHEVFPALGQRRLSAFTYISRPPHIDAACRPFPWYKNLVLAGALQSGLPSHHISAIQAVPTIPDPDADRISQHNALIVDSGFAALIEDRSR